MAIRENVLGIVRRFGIARVGVLTLTFPDGLNNAREAQRRFSSLRTGVLASRYGGYLRVFERCRTGAIHYHVLVPMPGDVRTGYQRPAHHRGRHQANALLRQEWAFLRDALPRYGFGRCELEPIRGTPDQLAAYFAKSIEDLDPVRALRDERVRVLEVSQALRTANSKISFLSEGGKQWRRKVAALVDKLVEAGKLPSGAGIEALAKQFGPAWALKFRKELLDQPDLPDPAELASCPASPAAQSPLANLTRIEDAAAGHGSSADDCGSRYRSDQEPSATLMHIPPRIAPVIARGPGTPCMRLAPQSPGDGAAWGMQSPWHPPAGPILSSDCCAESVPMCRHQDASPAATGALAVRPRSCQEADAVVSLVSANFTSEGGTAFGIRRSSTPRSPRMKSEQSHPFNLPHSGDSGVRQTPLPRHREPHAGNRLHPLCTAFPPICEEDLAQLVEDIQQNGLREPIVLLDGQVLDGRNRYHACLEAGVEARFRDFGSDKGDGADPAKFVMSKNAKRRHLTPGQLAVAAAKVQDWSQAAKNGGNRGNQHTGPCQSAPVQTATAAQRAATVGVSTRTQSDADLIVREAPELADQVTAGEVSLKAAAKQVRQRKGYSGGSGKGAPAAADHDSPPSLDASSPHEAAKPNKPADPKDARIAMLEQELSEARATLGELAAELEAYRAASTDEEAVKAIRDRDAQIATLEITRDSWMVKFNESVKTIKSLKRRLKKYGHVA